MSVRVLQLFGALCFILLVFVSPAAAENEAVEHQRAGLGANDLSDIASDGTALWITGSGSLNQRLWGDGSRYSDWMSYSQEPGFGTGSAAAILSTDDITILSWIYSKEYRGEMTQHGDGFSVSYDKGESWTQHGILDLFPERSSYRDPGNQTVTWDFDFSEGTLWAAVTTGFLLKSEDLGQTWENILPNADTLDVGNPLHYGYCVDAYQDTIWVGTIWGMEVSFDRGETWINHSWEGDSTDSMDNPKPGNFCTAVEHNVIDGVTHLWVSSRPSSAIGGNVGLTGICHSADHGETWDYRLTGYAPWNFAFGHDGANNPAVSDSTVFASTETGLIVSYDLGNSWSEIEIAEPDSVVSVVDGETVVSHVQGKSWDVGSNIYGLAVVSDSLWVTSSDGLAVSPDWGDTWKILKGVTRVKTLDEGKRDVGIASAFDETRSYAFPNPFSPKRSNQDYSRCRVQYALTNDASVSLAIHDYTGRKIRDLLDSEFRIGGSEYQEVWDGLDGDGNIVPNGVYFYILKTNKGDSTRGKIMVAD